MVIPTLADIPIHWMPVAVVLAYVVVAAWGRVAVHAVSPQRASTPKARQYAIVGAVAFGLYCLVMGRIEGAFQKAAHAAFDPYGVLELTQFQPTELNKTIVTDAYKEKVKHYHPSNPITGNPDRLQDVIHAFRALTDETAKRQWKVHGHPSGPLLTPIFQFAIPAWLFPSLGGGSGPATAAATASTTSSSSSQAVEDLRPILVGVHVVMISILGYLLVGPGPTSKSAGKRGDDDEDDDDDDAWSLEANQVSDTDLVYLARNVQPNSSHTELLLLALSAPSNLSWGRKDVRRVERMRTERRHKLQTSATSAPKFTFDELVSEGGWADDDEEETEDDKRLRQQAEEKKKSEVVLEGLDDNVVGQEWVERTLQANGEWPPREFGCLKGQTFDWRGTPLPPLEHPVLRRMLCMLSGRLNSQMLNSHPELVQAGINKLIDQSYFQASMIFRQRMSLLLEAVLKIGTSLHSYRLVKTGIETLTIFKVGCKLGSESWFQDVMVKQYGMPPKLNLNTLEIVTPGETEIATGENTQVTFEIERLHAENFLRQKIAQLEQQGIPPQVGLQAYREGWWFLVRCERLDGPAQASPLNRDDPFLQRLQLSDRQLALFNSEHPKDRLLVTLPMMLGNIAQKQIRAQGMIKAPVAAGDYEFTLEIKSIDFLGADVSRAVRAKVVDASKVVRVPKAENVGEKK